MVEFLPALGADEKIPIIPNVICQGISLHVTVPSAYRVMRNP